MKVISGISEGKFIMRKGIFMLGLTGTKSQEGDLRIYMWSGDLERHHEFVIYGKSWGRLTVELWILMRNWSILRFVFFGYVQAKKIKKANVCYIFHWLTDFINWLRITSFLIRQAFKIFDNEKCGSCSYHFKEDKQFRFKL